MLDDTSTVLSHFSLRHAGLEERFSAAADAGFTRVGLYTRAFAGAEAGGLDGRAQRRLADRHGLRVTDVEAVHPFRTADTSQVGHEAHDAEATAFRMADLFGCSYVQVIGPYPGDFDDAAADLAAFCDRAAEHGLRVGLEFLPFTNISDAGVAAAMVRAAGRPNGGVCIDTWHHFRGACDDGLLTALSPGQVAGVQISDGATSPVHPDYRTDCLENRMVPGEGDFDLVGLIRLLEGAGIDAPVSLEVISTQLQALPAHESARRVHDGYRRVLAEAHR